MTDEEILRLIRKRRKEDQEFNEEFEEAAKSKDKDWLENLIDRVLDFFKAVVENSIIAAILKFFGL